METINDIELKDPSVYPDDATLKRILGPSYGAYRELLELYKENGLEYQWRYYTDGKVWLCKVFSRRRTAVWMSAWKGYMQATIYLPEKHSDGVYALDIDEHTRERIRGTKKVGRSTPCIFEVRSADVLRDFDVVLQYKLRLK